MMDFLIEATGLIGAFISLFLSMLLLFSGEKTNRLLGILFFIYATGFALRFSLADENAGVFYLPFIFFPSVFIYGPILLSYTSSVLFGTSSIIKYKFLLSFIFLFILSLYSYFFIYDPDFSTMESIVNQKNNVYSFTLYLLISGVVYNLFFLFRSYLCILNYEKIIKSLYQEKTKRILRKIIWLKIFSGMNILIILTYAVLTAVNALEIYKSPVSFAEGILLFLLVYITLFYLIKRPDIFVIHENQIPGDIHDKEILQNSSAMKKHHPGASIKKDDTTKYSKQALAEEDRKIYIKKIENYMQEEKPYLNDHFSIADLSGALKISIHHCSMTINIEKKMNFFNFVNSYRLEEARKMLIDKGNKNETILNIAFRSGFQSKGAFNKAFKEKEGITPREYKNRIQIDRST